MLEEIFPASKSVTDLCDFRAARNQTFVQSVLLKPPYDGTGQVSRGNPWKWPASYCQSGVKCHKTQDIR